MTAQLSILDYIEAKSARDLGITSAADHADDVTPGWTDIAFQWIKTYALAHAEFISEECTESAKSAGIPNPPDARAWGKPFSRAAQQKIIVRNGYGVSKRRHLSPTPRWASQTYRSKP